MANRKKEELRKRVLLLKKTTDYTLRQIAQEVGLPDRQWVYYYLKDAKRKQ